MEADQKPVAATPWIRSILQFFDRIEVLMLSTLLGIMMLLSCWQILLRTFFSSGLLWADPLLRYLVLWCGMLGAVSAAGQGKHIAIDLIGNRLDPRVEPYLDFLVNF
jgi:TRAP-type C4-dicarboxylate transport system permease small subunit